MKTLLLHEMAHAATNTGHGKKWQSEMGRLLQCGAPVEGELEPYKRSARPIGEPQILGEFEDGGTEGLPWANLRLSIGYEHGFVNKRGGPANGAARRFLRKAYYAWRKGRSFREKYLAPDGSG